MGRLRTLLFVLFGCLVGYSGANVALTYAQERPAAPPVASKARPVAPVGASIMPKAYHCPMHPDSISDKPGECPICGMTLVPVPTRVVPPPGGVQPKGEKPSDWAAAAWQWATGRGIVDGREPKKPCTREMAVTWLYRYYQREYAEIAQLRREQARSEQEEERAATPFVPISGPETPSPSGLLLSDLTCYRASTRDLGLDGFPPVGTPVRVVGKINNTGSEPVELAGDVVGIEGYDEEGHLLVAEVLSTTPTAAPPSFSMLPFEVISGKSQIGPTEVPPGGYATFQAAILGAPAIASVKVRVLR